MTFAELNLDPKLLEGLEAMGFEKPTPVQQMTIPLILQNRDLIACAQTGTGKTAAYVLPLLNKISQTHESHRHLNTLVLAPTRELALQIDQQVEGFGYFLGISSVPVYGGSDGATWDQQRKAIEAGADIIIATPGRLIQFLATGRVDFSRLKHLVLDEADRMLDMGFYDDIVRIIKQLPADRQTVMFSATMPPRIRSMAKQILREPEEISIAISKPAAGISQQAYMVHDHQKLPLLKKLLSDNDYKSAIIFANSKENVKKLGRELARGGMAIKAFHSDLEQSEREEIMNQFKSRRLQMLIGTDILSRGIDVEGIELVVNYDTPHDAEDYVHRIGRTARAERTGTAITFVNEKDLPKFRRVEKLIGSEIVKNTLPEELGEAPVFESRNGRRKKSGGKFTKSSAHSGESNGSAKKPRRKKRFSRRREGNPNPNAGNSGK